MKNNNKGFSLVELIVVIAIMAILAAVAVVGFSMYIPKAQQASDKQMVADIEYVLSLHAQSNPEDVTAGYIILSTGKAQASEGFAIEVLKATYGADWEDELKLAYDGWVVNTALLEAAQTGGSNVTNSIFVQQSNPTELLENVQTVTQAAAGLLGSVTKTEEQYITALSEALGPNYMAQAADAGLLNVETVDGSLIYSMPDGAFDNDGKLNADMQTQLSNLMVLSVAEEMKTLTTEDMAKIMDNTYDGNASSATRMAVVYSVVKATDLKQGGNTEAFTTLNNGLQNATGMDDVTAAIYGYTQSGGEAQWKDYFYEGEGENETVSDEALANLGAVSAIMNGVSSVSGDYKNADSLKDANLFTSGSVSNYLNLYVSAAALQLPDDIPDNGIVLIYQMGEDGAMYVYPLYS